MNNTQIALTWCLAWGEKKEPNYELSILKETRRSLIQNLEISSPIQPLINSVRQLEEKTASFPKTIAELTQITEELSNTWHKKIGLVYGGATKIKQYVFESANLQEIRGASAILDRINLIDLPGFFGKTDKYQKNQKLERYKSTEKWLDKNFPQLKDALIPELIIYSTGGNILAFCPAAFVDELANAIEKRYTEETLTANSCAVGVTFKLLETRFGLLKDKIEETQWLNWYLSENVKTNPLVEAYFGKPEVGETYQELFKNRKNFNELIGKLATLFNQRRSGNQTENRPSRQYPPIFETHPYLQRDNSDARSAITRLERFPQQPWLSESSARKLLMGQITKRIKNRAKLAKLYAQNLYQKGDLNWKPGKIKSWVDKFTDYLKKSQQEDSYYSSIKVNKVEQARSLKEIANASNGYVAFIYADGNNLGGYIQKSLKTPEDYQRFSLDIFHATEYSVYQALAEHIKPHTLNNLTGEEAEGRNNKVIHPFEILAIGGDDVLLIVPANKALAITKTIGEEFEAILLKEKQLPDLEIIGNYILQQFQTEEEIKQTHRQTSTTAKPSKCKLSMSAGVLITSQSTPVYYAENLTNQLLKSAKKKAKELKKESQYYGGTVDFLVLKSVTMISSNIEAFREEALIKKPSGKTKLKLYAAPYTLQELGGFINTVRTLKASQFPKSQLYQIRSLLERGKNTAILNYRYFRVRLAKQKQKLLQENFEAVWCQAKTNDGNIAPWMSYKDKDKAGKEIISYETIWREIIDIYPFIDKPEDDDLSLSNFETKKEVNQ